MPARIDTNSPAARRVLARSSGPTRWLTAIILAVPLLLTYGYFGRFASAPLLFDDHVTITNNHSILSLWPLYGTTASPGPLNPTKDLTTAGRPLVNFTIALNYWFDGVNPRGYHWVSLAIHFLNSLLLWALIRRTLCLPRFGSEFARSASWLALVVALLWALHPLQTETVTYITQRTELMVAFFYLSTLYSSLRYFEPHASDACEPTDSQLIPTASGSVWWLVLAVLSCFCGMASKESMVSAPVIVLLFDRMCVSDTVRNAVRKSWRLYIGLAASWLLLLALNISQPRSNSAGFGVGPDVHWWCMTQCKVLLMYLKLVVWPSPLLLYYDFPLFESLADAWSYVLVVAILALVALVLLYRNKPTGFLLAAAAAILAPTFVVPVITEVAAERRMYLPLAAIATMFVAGGYKLLRKRSQPASAPGEENVSQRAPSLTALLVPAFLLAITYAIASAAHVRDYQNESILWLQVIAEEPKNFMAHYNLGMYYNHNGREAESLAELEASVVCNRDYPQSLSSYAFALINAERIPEAISVLTRTLEIDPDYAPAYNNLGIAYNKSGRPAEAVKVLQRAHELAPSNVNFLSNLARAWEALGRKTDELETLKLAYSLDSKDADITLRLATLLSVQNNLKAAEPVWQQYHQLEPSDPGGCFNLANTLVGLGNLRGAAPLFEQGLKLQPDAQAHFVYATILAELGRNQEAIAQLRASIRLRPGYAEAYGNLAELLARSGQFSQARQTAAQGIRAATAAGDSDSAAVLEAWLKEHANK